VTLLTLLKQSLRASVSGWEQKVYTQASILIVREGFLVWFLGFLPKVESVRISLGVQEAVQ